MFLHMWNDHHQLPVKLCPMETGSLGTQSSYVADHDNWPWAPAGASKSSTVKAI